MVVVSGTSSFETWPAWEDTEVRGAQVSLLLLYFFVEGKVLDNMVEVLAISQLHSQRPSFCFGVFDPDSMTLASRTELCHNLLVTVKRTIGTALPLKYFCQLCPTKICFSKLSEKLIGEYIFLCWLLICQIKDTVPKCSKATSQLPHWHIWHTRKEHLLFSGCKSINIRLKTHIWGLAVHRQKKKNNEPLQHRQK